MGQCGVGWGMMSGRVMWCGMAWARNGGERQGGDNGNGSLLGASCCFHLLAMADVSFVRVPSARKALCVQITLAYLRPGPGRLREAMNSMRGHPGGHDQTTAFHRG